MIAREYGIDDDIYVLLFNVARRKRRIESVQAVAQCIYRLINGADDKWYKHGKNCHLRVKKNTTNKFQIMSWKRGIRSGMHVCVWKREWERREGGEGEAVPNERDNVSLIAAMPNFTNLMLVKPEGAWLYPMHGD